MAIDLTPMRELNLSIPVAQGRPNFLCAASGLVGIENNFYVVADDELSLGIFPATGDGPGKLFPVFPGELPEHHTERKKQKPDLEAITYLSKEHFRPFGAILVVPSGSKPNRFAGGIIPLQKNGDLDPNLRTVDFGQLYKELRLTFSDLNIEGAVISNANLKLFQRGNARAGKNAVIDVCLTGLLEDLLKDGKPSGQHIQSTSFVDLGELHGTPLSFTDAALYMDKEIWFLAVAEKTDSTYDDGEFCGASIGYLNQDGSLGKMYELNCPQKPEGLWFSQGHPHREFVVVTDSDHPACPSMLYRGTISS